MRRDDERFTSNALRVQHRKELIDLLSSRFAEKNKQEWLELLEQHRVPCGPINNLKVEE
jgi:crotonobetainyl-CoA:carnitine CoA-transferase CaiB-like acyl-CoA transferase